jgi:hypothetical protein
MNLAVKLSSVPQEICWPRMADEFSPPAKFLLHLGEAKARPFPLHWA